MGDIRSTLREAKIGYSGISRNDNGVSVRITKPEDLERARDPAGHAAAAARDGHARQRRAGQSLRPCLRTTSSSRLTFSQAGLDAKIASAISQSLKIIESRVNALGTAEPTIQQQGKDRIVVQLPGVQNPGAGQERHRPYREADLPARVRGPAHRPRPEPAAECQASLTVKETPDQNMWVQTSTPGDRRRRRSRRCPRRLRPAEPAGRLLPLQHPGCRTLRQADDRDNVGRPFAIILDSEVVSVPNINEPIIGGCGSDLRQFHGAGGQRPRHRAALGRPAGEAHHRGRAHRGPQPRLGFDPRRPHRLD